MLAEPAPSVVVSELADDITTVAVQSWTGSEHYAVLQRDISDRLLSVI